MIKEVLYAFHTDSAQIENHRFRSWEHCITFFRNNKNQLQNATVADHACLHLAFYLASWGMLRNSFLLQRDYKVHQKFLQDVVVKPEYTDLLAGRVLLPTNVNDMELLESLIEDTCTVYLPILREVNRNDQLQVSDTLISKILLGVFGVVPAYDRFFKEAAGFHGINKQFNITSFKQLHLFYNRFSEEFNSFIEETAKDSIRYTPMKVLDMYFWKIGDIFSNGKDVEQKERLVAFISHVKEKPMQTPADSYLKTGNRTEDIRRHIAMILQSEKTLGQNSAIICARDIHNDLNLSHSYPSVCNAMGSVPGYKEYDIVYAPPSGKSSTVTYRYKFEGENDDADA
ncbi:hypothetical protein [Bacillus sp. FJAT-22090]|uniref:hypothetical protein n=1 Tax=Bacillus sp. FJAT-22090 TaxID=1581038 RepID=UPI0011A7665A|nr:hypothetical protein [Bacillus sp. FJAT-22090]